MGIIKVKTKEMKKLKIVGVTIALIFLIVIAWYLIDRFSYSKELPYYVIPEDIDTTLTIGIIGDSWVDGRKLDTILYDALLEYGIKSKVISSGCPGAKSKLIYQKLSKENDEYSSQFIIEKSPDYCIVIGGVNDAGSQIGSHYYSYHMIQIIKTLLHYDIKPVVVSLPEFDVEDVIDNMNVLSRTRNIISAQLNNDGIIDNINIYRQVFNEALEQEIFKDSILIIDFDKVCPDYSQCPELYANSSHLSKMGNEKLVDAIAEELNISISAKIQN